MLSMYPLKVTRAFFGAWEDNILSNYCGTFAPDDNNIKYIQWFLIIVVFRFFRRPVIMVGHIANIFANELFATIKD